MRQFYNQNSVLVQRQFYTNNVSAFSTIATVAGYLRSLDPETASQNGFQYGYGFSFITDFGTDIRPGDKLLIAHSFVTTTYTVHGVTQNGITQNPTAYLKAIITLPE